MESHLFSLPRAKNVSAASPLIVCIGSDTFPIDWLLARISD